MFAMNERVKKLTEEIRKLSPDEQADLIDELLVLTYRDRTPRETRPGRKRSIAASILWSEARPSSSMRVSIYASTRSRDFTAA
jgi:hypothetical protein